ncbi:MAG: hypothetical protein RMY16_15710 [Nostoc sp. DedQUE12b]|nr:hypothetical protein [Nostoc sp. DedQUE12b]MDZ8086985.1 hypothetical protein [Nostoc sp. DedQUE12b]
MSNQHCPNLCDYGYIIQVAENNLEKAIACFQSAILSNPKI